MNNYQEKCNVVSNFFYFRGSPQPPLKIPFENEHKESIAREPLLDTTNYGSILDFNKRGMLSILEGCGYQKEILTWGFWSIDNIGRGSGIIGSFAWGYPPGDGRGSGDFSDHLGSSSHSLIPYRTL